MLNALKTTLVLLAISCASASPHSVGGARSIVLERGCPGCAAPNRISLFSDGRVQTLRAGMARFGTSDQRQEGRMPAGSFATIEALAIGGNFARLDAHYADPELQDGPWMTLTITQVDGTEKQVFRRSAAGPALLQQLEDAIDAAVAGSALRPPRDKP